MGLFSSPFRTAHGAKRRFWRHGLSVTPRAHSRLLFGEREMAWPLLALQARQDLGPARHALAQRVVAGITTVFPPVFVRLPEGGESNDKPAPGA